MVSVLPQLARRYGLRFIALFGSVAEGRATAESDLDVAVMADRPRRRALDWQARLVVALGEVLETSREVDLLLLNGADSLISFRVASRGDCPRAGAAVPRVLRRVAQPDRARGGRARAGS